MESDVLKKLGFKTQNPVLILNAPDSYQNIIKEIPSEVHNEIRQDYLFVQIFVKSADEANKYVQSALQTYVGDGHFWVCYPKGTSKKFKTDLNRNKLAELIGCFNLEPVTQIAIDDDWSAMRFRRAEDIKSLNRKSAFSASGKERIKKDDVKQ
jgi:hypothetical protein